MTKRSERSLVFLSMIFVFACLLLSGGSRLIGCDAQEEPIKIRTVSLIRAAFAGMPAPRAETGQILRDEPDQPHAQTAHISERPILKDRVLSDANGNVLGGQTYMRAVYQAFVLDDGFV